MKNIPSLFAQKYNAGSENGQMSAFVIIAALFCTGAISAICCGSLQNLSTACTLDDIKQTNVQLALYVLRFLWLHIAAAFLGSSFYGCFLLPLLAGLGGFSLYREAEVVLATGISEISVTAFAALVLLVPCFIVIAVDSMCASMQLRRLLCCCSVQSDKGGRLRLLLCMAFAALAALTTYYF